MAKNPTTRWICAECETPMLALCRACGFDNDLTSQVLSGFESPLMDFVH
jgi:hypothetical protein